MPYRSPLASMDLRDIFNPKPLGEPVNTHVVRYDPTPTPDYEMMQRFVNGEGPLLTKNDERDGNK